MSNIINELETLTKKIEENTAGLEDYKRYEIILLDNGLTRDYIFSYLHPIGLYTWEEFIAIRKRNSKDPDEATAIGGIIGIGGGLILSNIIDAKIRRIIREERLAWNSNLE